MYLTTLFCVLLCLRMTAAMHIFTAIYRISSLLNLLFTRFSSSSCQSGLFVLFYFLWSQQPEVLVSAVHLAVGTFSESLLFLDVLKALFLCPWTNSMVFAMFCSFFQLELFLQKTRFWVFREIHSFHNMFFSFKGGVGWEGDNYVHNDFRHGML